jgi:hypothetical protein
LDDATHIWVSPETGVCDCSARHATLTPVHDPAACASAFSTSSGTPPAILFGLIYGFLAIVHSELLFQSPFLLVVGLAMVSGFFALGKIYWFRIPFTGFGISLACYVTSIVVSRA